MYNQVALLSILYAQEYQLMPGKFMPIIDTRTENQGKVNIDVFIQVFQQKSIRIMHDLVLLKRKFKDKININSHYVACNIDRNTFSITIGGQELEETLRQIAISKYLHDKTWEYLEVRNIDIYNPEWIPYAKFSGLNSKEIKKIKEKSNSKSVYELLKKHFYLAKKLKLQQIPGIYINGEEYKGILNLFGLASNINSLLPEKEKVKGIPDSKLPERMPIEVLAIVNTNGWGNDTSRLKLSLPSIFPEMAIIEIDYRSKQGTKLLKKYNINLLPAFLIKKLGKHGRQKKQNIESFSKVEEILEMLIKSKLLLYEKGWNYCVIPPAEIVYGLYFKRLRKENTLDVFTMSHCPWGLRAINQLIRIRKQNKSLKDVDINIHFIANPISTSTPKDLTELYSVHGLAEIEEDIRQLIIQKYFPNKFFDYLLIRNQKIESSLWHKALEEVEIDRSFIEQKIETEGLILLLQNISLATELSIKASTL